MNYKRDVKRHHSEVLERMTYYASLNLHNDNEQDKKRNHQSKKIKD